MRPLQKPLKKTGKQFGVEKMFKELEVVIPEYVEVAFTDIANKTGTSLEDVAIFFLTEGVVHTQP